MRPPLQATLISLLSFTSFVAQASAATPHSLHGVVQDVDKGAKTVVIKMDDGMKQTVHFTDRTAIHTKNALDRGAVDAYLATHKGMQVVVRFTENAGDKVAIEVRDVAEKSANELKK